MSVTELTEERREEIRTLYGRLHNAEAVSRQLGVPSTTVRRFCRDMVKVRQVAEGKKRAARIQEVVALRQEMRANKEFDLKAYAKKHGLSLETVSKAVRGYSFKEANELAPPVFRDNVKPDEKERARALYVAGRSVRQITAELRVSKSSVSLWCRDLIAANLTRLNIPKLTKAEFAVKKEEARKMYAEGGTVIHISAVTKIGSSTISRWCKDLIAARRDKFYTDKEILDNRPRNVNGPQVLTNQNVIDIRRDIKTNGQKGWRYYANKYQVGLSTVSMAARGITFKGINHIESPVDTTDPKIVRVKSGLAKKIRPDDALAAEALVMRRADPEKWTYETLAAWFREKTGRKYKTGHVTNLLRQRDPSIRDLEPPPPPKPPKVPKVKASRRRLPLTNPQKQAKAAVDAAYKAKQKEERERLAEEAAIQRLIEEEDRYEREMAEKVAREAAAEKVNLVSVDT